VEQTVITALHLSHSRCCPESDEYHNRPLRKLHPRSLVNIMLPVPDACGFGELNSCEMIVKYCSKNKLARVSPYNGQCSQLHRAIISHIHNNAK
jgi:hypothetical protein